MNKGVAAFFVTGCFVSFVMGQGSLIPPGPPAPTMKTLAQLDEAIIGVSNAVKEIEARIPISNAVHEIHEPGSYYLVENLDHGITIHNDITLDLNGFALEGSSGTGIQCYGNVHVHNGSVQGFDGHGISGRGIFRNLRILYNGGYDDPYDPYPATDYGFGIDADQAVVENCYFEGNANGLRLMSGRAVGNEISGNSNGGIGLWSDWECYVSENVVRGYGTGYEIYGEQNFVVKNVAINNEESFVIIPGDSTNGVGTIRTTPAGAGPWDNFELSYSWAMP